MSTQVMLTLRYVNIITLLHGIFQIYLNSTYLPEWMRMGKIMVAHPNFSSGKVDCTYMHLYETPQIP